MEGPEAPKPSVTLRDATSFIDDVSKYYNTDELSDIVLQVGDREYPAHKFILGKSSEVRDREGSRGLQAVQLDQLIDRF